MLQLVRNRPPARPRCMQHLFLHARSASRPSDNYFCLSQEVSRGHAAKFPRAARAERIRLVHRVSIPSAKPMFLSRFPRSLRPDLSRSLTPSPRSIDIRVCPLTFFTRRRRTRITCPPYFLKKFLYFFVKHRDFH